jgi:XTP/dITP diphosphohydrolase
VPVLEITQAGVAVQFPEPGFQRMSSPLIQIASSNQGKLTEIMLGVELWQRETRRRLDCVIELMPGFANFAKCEETSDSFAGNARKKAVYYAGLAAHENVYVLSDDSGLAVEALHGAPGIFSARYAGPNATDAENNARLLRDLAGIAHERRTARFVCVLALAGREGLVREFSGVARGIILDEPRGTQGFGYDPLFLDAATGKTFAEMTAEEKLAHSHRGKALFSFLDWITQP